MVSAPAPFVCVIPCCFPACRPRACLPSRACCGGLGHTAASGTALQPRPPPAAGADNSAKLWGFIQDTPWAGGIKLVPVTAEGLSLPGFNYQLLQSMTPLRVETWADFSARLVRGSPPAPVCAWLCCTLRHAAADVGSPPHPCQTDTSQEAPPASQVTITCHAALPCPQPQGGPPPVQPGPPPSAEGGHQRCFDSMLICTHGLNITRWPLHSFGRHLVEAYRHLLAPEAQAAAGTESAARAGGAGAPATSGITVLNVVFQKRLGDTRQILNLEELLQLCNRWRHTTAAGRRFGFKCWEVSGAPCVARGTRFCTMHEEHLYVRICTLGFQFYMPYIFCSLLAQAATPPMRAVGIAFTPCAPNYSFTAFFSPKHA